MHFLPIFTVTVCPHFWIQVLRETPATFTPLHTATIGVVKDKHLSLTLFLKIFLSWFRFHPWCSHPLTAPMTIHLPHFQRPTFAFKSDLYLSTILMQTELLKQTYSVMKFFLSVGLWNREGFCSGTILNSGFEEFWTFCLLILKKISNNFKTHLLYQSSVYQNYTNNFPKSVHLNL